MASNEAEQLASDSVELSDRNPVSSPAAVHAASLESGWLVAGTLLFAVVLGGAGFSWWRSDPPAKEFVAELGLSLDLNKATAAQLQALPDVGPQLAGRIVRFREENGPFESVEDLQQVRGVGPITLNELRAFLVVNERSDEGLNGSASREPVSRHADSTPSFPTMTPSGEDVSQ